MKIRLSAADAQRLGCPEELEYDETKLMGREAIAIQKQTGWTPERVARAMEGRIVRDENGDIEYLEDEHGDRVLDEGGRPIPFRDVDAEALLITAWTAVRRSVPEVKWADFDIDLFGTQFGEPPAAEPSTGETGDQGKS